MNTESHHLLKKRIQELETEAERLRGLIPQEFITEEFLDRISINDANDSVSVIDTNYTLVEVNDKRLQGTNMQRNELIGKKCYNVFYDIDKPCEECTIEKVIESNAPDHFLKSYMENSKIKFEEKYISPVLNKNGAVERIIVQSKDISSYYHLVDRVGQREEFYKNTFESAGDAFLVHDEKGQLIEFSSRLCKMLGYSEKELAQLNVNDIDDPKDSEDFVVRKNEMDISGTAIFETNLIRKCGKRIPVEVSANINRFANTKIYFVAIRNIEKRKIAEHKLSESEERFRTLVENAPDLIMRFDRDHKHLFVNSASNTVLNIKPEAFIGKTHFDMGFPTDMCEFWEQEMNLAFESKQQHCVDFTLTLDDEIRYFEWQLIPEFNAEGESETLMAIARDISVRKRTEIALNDAIKTKDKFFSIIAHDLKNPFNALLPIAKNLYLHCNEMSKAQIAESSEIIHSSASQEFKLLNNLLEWGRSQMGKISLNPKQIDLQKIVTSNILLHKVKADKKNIAVSVDIINGSMAFADEYMIDTVIRNLYSNALKFSRAGGEVNIKIRNNQSKAILSLEDNGIGISAENQKRLFRIDTNYTRMGTEEESGTGLGLILCKEFVDQNNGKIYVESTVEKGSVFFVELPLQ